MVILNVLCLNLQPTMLIVMYTESLDPREIERFCKSVEESDVDGIDGSDGGAPLLSVSLVIHVWEIRDSDDVECVTPQVTQWIYPSIGEKQ